MSMESVLEEVAGERARQDSKWGQQNGSGLEWVTILGEEFGETAHAILEMDGPNYREELIQCAAVCVAAVEAYDRNGGVEFR